MRLSCHNVTSNRRLVPYCRLLVSKGKILAKTAYIRWIRDVMQGNAT
uniref:Uncharacterized protein n=1 Tax=Anguilla anguilla TaxID=7936 RepID=A0A0E9SNS9_ANGAN